MARKAAALALSVLFIAMGLLVSTMAPAKTSACPNTTTPATELTLRQLHDSVFCLINKERAANGRSQLRGNRLLHQAAVGYARSMMAGRFFSHHGDLAGHDNAGTVIGRLRQIGYIKPGFVWVVGENLRWSYQEANTPAAVVQAWMDSPEHKMYLLKPKFDELGVGVLRGYPDDPSDLAGITVTSEFGFRRN